MVINEQHLKETKFRNLKIFFYCLGFPLFIFIVVFGSIQFAMKDPFTANASGLMSLYKSVVFGSAFYGLWAAFGLWALASLIHVLYHFIIKNHKTRTLAIIATLTLLMFGSVMAMDIVFSSQIKDLQANAYPGVSVADYKDQLQYFKIYSTNAQFKSSTQYLIDKVASIKSVYFTGGMDLNGGNHSIDNQALYYDTIISDEGVLGLDISFVNGQLLTLPDGDDSNDHILVEIAPDADGYLVINNKRYSNYYCYDRWDGVNEKIVYSWFMKACESEKIKDGEYGEATYYKNGLLGDGWVPSIETVLRVLRCYYGSDEKINKMIKDKVAGLMYYDGSTYDEIHSEIIQAAQERRESYYSYLADGQAGVIEYLADEFGYSTSENYSKDTKYQEYINYVLKTAESGAWYSTYYYELESTIAGQLTLTQSELGNLIAQVGSVLGSNELFDFLLSADGTIGEIIQPILSQLQNGMSLGDLIGDSKDSVMDIIGKVFGTTLDDAYLVLVYKGTAPDGTYYDHLYISLNKDSATGEPLLDINFDESVFSIDAVSNLINTVIDNFGFGGTINTIWGLVKGLINIPYEIFDSNGHIDITNILMQVLSGIYWYQSSVIDPIYTFYVDYSLPADSEARLIQEYFAEHDRAEFTGKYRTAQVGSQIVGVDGGLTNIVEVEQVILDLSYQPIFYPFYELRDLLLFFSSFVIFFYFISCICSMKEEEARNGIFTKHEIKKIKKKEARYKKAEKTIKVVMDAATDAAGKIGEYFKRKPDTLPEIPEETEGVEDTENQAPENLEKEVE